MSNIDNNPYITVEDKHGAKAKVFFSADGDMKLFSVIITTINFLQKSMMNALLN